MVQRGWKHGEFPHQGTPSTELLLKPSYKIICDISGWTCRNIFVHAGPPFEARWSLYVPPAWTLKEILRSAHVLYLCVLCGSQNKQRLFPYAALTDWFL